MLEVDLAIFSLNNRGLLPKNKNDGNVGLVVVVDVLSGYAGARAFKTKSPEFITPLVRSILTQFKTKMSFKDGTLMTDGGSEFSSAKTEFGNVFTDMVTGMGLIYKQAPKRTCVHVESKNKDIRQAINSRLHASGSVNWVGIYPAIVKRMNTVKHVDS